MAIDVNGDGEINIIDMAAISKEYKAQKQNIKYIINLEWRIKYYDDKTKRNRRNNKANL